MPDTEKTELPEDELTSTDTAVAEEEEEKLPPLTLEVKVDTRSTCERHVTVTISREDIDRYFDKEFSELMPTAHVPGFRPGHAPRKLVETRFRKDVAEKVKGELLMDSLTQVNEEQKLSAISEPEFDFEAIELPDEGPLTFEFDVEVRPEFDGAAVEGAEDREAGARVQRGRRERHVAERPGPPRAVGAVRRSGLLGRLRHLQPDVQA